jgi:hypothetical protein
MEFRKFLSLQIKEGNGIVKAQVVICRLHTATAMFQSQKRISDVTL